MTTPFDAHLVGQTLSLLGAALAEGGGRPAQVAARLVPDQRASGLGQSRQEVIDQLQTGIAPDGTAGHGFLPTAWRLHQLLDLGMDATSHTVASLLGWLLGQQGKEGQYGAGCTAFRHQHHVCEHYLASFFSPGPSATRLAPLTLPWGKTFRAEPAARFACSCVALVAVLRTGRRPKSIRQHLDSLMALHTEWEAWDDYLPPDLAFSAVACLAMSVAHGTEADRLLSLLDRRLTSDGWPGVNLWHAATGLLWSVDRPKARMLLRRLAPVLCAHVDGDGHVRGSGATERALVTFRVLAEVHQH